MKEELKVIVEDDSFHKLLDEDGIHQTTNFGDTAAAKFKSCTKVTEAAEKVGAAKELA